MPVAADDLLMEADVDDVTFGVGFTQLSTCKKAAKDDFPEITDVRSWVGSYLKQADQRHGGKIATFVGGRLTPEARNVLVSYWPVSVYN